MTQNKLKIEVGKLITNISGNFIITTTTANFIITVINAVGNTTALTITPNAGGTEQVSAHLVITQIA